MMVGSDVPLPVSHAHPSKRGSSCPAQFCHTRRLRLPATARRNRHSGHSRRYGPARARDAAHTPRSPLLAKLTSLTSIATARRGRHDRRRHSRHRRRPLRQAGRPRPAGSAEDLLPKPATNPGLAAYAGQQVLTGKQAKLYAQKQIGVDLTKVAGGKTYSQVSAEWIAGGMKNTTLAS